MNYNEFCTNCFKPHGGEEVCMHCGHVQKEKPKQLCHLFPRTILNNRYLIGEVINNGGFGVVYKAYDIKLENIVAIKELLPTQNSIVNRMPGETQVVPVNEQKAAHFEDLKTRFLIEARTMAQFNSVDSIVHIFDFFEENNTAYLVMEFIEGITLRKYMEEHEGPISYEETMRIMFPVMQALSFVHKQKILHRDISPENIMLTNNGGVKLIDFGAAKLSETEVQIADSVVLKPGYTPPEQYRSQAKVGPYTDVYSVGAVIYRMLTGVFPEESIDRAEKDNLLIPSRLNVQMPLFAEKSVMKAMAIRENARFKTMDDFIDAMSGKKRADFPEKELKKKKILRNVSVISIFLVVITSVLSVYFIKKNNSIVPTRNAKLTIWYVKDDNSKQECWEAITSDFEEFCKAQNDDLKITVELVAKDEETYKADLEKAMKDGKGPDIYETDTLDENKYASSLETIYKQAEDKKFYSEFDLMCETLKNKNEIAFCFDQPVWYVNTDVVVKEETLDDYKSLEDLDKFETNRKLINDNIKYLVSPEAVLSVASAYDNKEYEVELVEKTDAKGIDLFSKGKNAAELPYYIGMMSDFSEINAKENTGTNGFDVYALPGAKYDCIVFPETWSINKNSTNADKKAADFLMYFMLCEDEGQTDMTEVGHNTYYLPFLCETADSVKTGYTDYKFIYDEKSEREHIIVGYKKEKKDNSK